MEPIAISLGLCETDTNISLAQFAHAAYGCDSCGLGERSGQADWGYNAIANGGNQEGLWRTLSSSEWKYLLETRDTKAGIRYAKAIVNDVNGLILFPDEWDPTLFHIENANDPSSHNHPNTISVEDWDRVFEPSGAIFLPAGGITKHREPWWEINGNYGTYWSASRCTSWLCLQMVFDDWLLVPEHGWYPHSRAAVRLVRDKE